MPILDYLKTTGGIIWTAACVPISILLAWLAVWVMNKIPASWLCDYNETPSRELLEEPRAGFRREGVILSVLLTFCLAGCRLQFNKGFDIYFLCFAMIILLSLMIAVCDIKYMIIPDQFTAALALIGAALSIYDIVRGFRILHSTWWSPLAGLAIGAGTMLLIDLIGMLLYKKDGMGFGDVKLFAAVGLLTGFPGTIYTFIVSILTATVFFVCILLAAKVRKSPEPDKTEESDEKEEPQELSAKSYLAFGPYIAAALIAYIALFDVIHYLANLYIDLF